MAILGLWALVLLAAAPPATICVRAEQSPSLPPGLSETEIVAALRARVSSEALSVLVCAPETPVVWSLTLRGSQDPAKAELELAAADLLVRRRLPIGRLREHERAQLAALVALEAIRSTPDFLLEQLHHPRPPAADEAPALPPLPPASPVAAVPPPSLLSAFGLEVAAVVDGEPAALSGSLALSVERRIGSLALGLRAAARRFPSGEAGGFRIQANGYELGSSLALQQEGWGLGAGVSARLVELSLSGDSAAARTGSHLSWSGGVGVVGELWPLRFSNAEVGWLTRVWIWWPPRRFRVSEHVLLRQSQAELVMGPSVRVRF